MSPAQVKLKRIIEICKYIYTPLIFACIFYYIFKNSDLLVDLFSKAKPLFLIYAVLLWASLHLLAPLSPLLILRCLGYSLPYKKLLGIYIARLPARYLPGGIWHTVGRLADYRSCGIAKRHISFLAFFETIFPIPATFFIGGTLLWINSPRPLPYSLDIISTIASCTILLVPFFLLIWNPFKKYPPSRNSFFYLNLLLLSFIFWSLAASSFIFYFNSVALDKTAQQSLFSLAGAYIFSWGTGYIAIFAPQGIGVFEVIAGKLIDLPLNLGSSVAFLAGFRLIALLADFLIYVSFWLNPFGVKKRPFPKTIIQMFILRALDSHQEQQ